MPRSNGINQELIREFKHLRDSAAFYSLTFSPVEISAQDKRRIEREIQQAFKLWWDSWILPKILIVEDKLCKPKQKGPK